LLSFKPLTTRLLNRGIEELEARWTLPTISSYKVNVDGAVFAQSRQSGIGVVIQDHEGRVMIVLSKTIHQPLGLLEAKAKSMEVGVFFCIRCWYKRCSS